MAKRKTPSYLKKFTPRDFISHVDGYRYIERERTAFSHDSFGNKMNIHECPRECHFYRRGDCWLNDFSNEHMECNHMYYWQRVDSDGWLRDRDGWIGYLTNDKKYGTRIDDERNIIDEFGNKTGRTLR